MENEIWKDVPGWEGMYMASSLGRIKSLKRKNIIILSPVECGGYLRVGLLRDGIHRKFAIHRIIASTFLGLDLYGFIDPKLSLCVCHKDDNPKNNRVDNLFLGTNHDNIIDRDKKGRRIVAKGEGNWLSKPVVQMTIEGEFIRNWCSAAVAGRELGISFSKISAVCRGERKTSGGYKWKFIN